MGLFRTLYVFHYHLLAGGVSTVIRDSLLSLVLHSKINSNIERIVLVTGGEAYDSLPFLDHETYPTIIHDRLDLIGYDDRTTSVSDQHKMANLLLQRYNAGIWWVHNHHLAKNCCFTGAVLIAAATGQPLLLQVHDFPENARLFNLRRLLQEVPFSPYPTGPNVHYIVLNNRDRAALLAAGLTTADITLLTNPIQPMISDNIFKSDDAQRAKNLLRKASSDGLSFGTGALDHHKPVWLYPARTRRRKNILEAGLLARLSQANLLVTLRSSSIYEKLYSRQVEELFADGTIPGLFGIGDDLRRIKYNFHLLITAASRIISSSVEEGFGFQFINALQWKRPLIARRLPVLDDISSLLVDYPAIIYDAVLCPISNTDRKTLKSAYQQKMSQLSAILRKKSIDKLQAELETTLSQDMIDFSFLNIEQQVDLLKRMTDKSLVLEIELSNKILLANLQKSENSPPDRNSQINEQFGYDRYVRSLSKIFTNLSSQPKQESSTVIVEPEIVRECFANPGMIRLLMGS